MTGELERVRKALRELGKLLRSLPANPPPKEVHKLRTVTRRVEAIAAVLPPSERKKSRRLLKPIEPVRKAAGDVRDMDVLISNARRMARHSAQNQNSRALPKSQRGGFSLVEKPLKGRAIGYSYSGSAVAGDSLTRLINHLESARNESAAELRRTLGRRRKAARYKLKQYSKLVRSALTPAKSAAPNLGQSGQSQEGVRTAAMNVVRELGDWPPLDAGNIHAFRVKVKELRYILQLNADADPGFVDALGEVQRRIGDWHDWQQLSEIASEVLDPRQDDALLTRISVIAKRKFDQALTSANTLRGRHLAMPFAVGI
jgi:CHAD domain-containing protein